MEDKILLTARYVEGDLSETEKIEFEAALLNDQTLQQHLKDYQHVHQSLKMQLVRDDRDKLFLETLTTFNKTYFKTEEKVLSLKSYIKWMGAVAAVLVVAVLIWAPWNKDLYQQYAGDQQMMVAERGEVKETALSKAAALFNEKKYTEAKPILEQLTKTQPTNAMIAYYYAYTLLQTNNIEDGRLRLIQLYNGESAFKYDAAFAIALSYLKDRNQQESRTWLLKIPAGTAHYQKATSLLEKLR